ncbi:CheR family methyltransferase [Desulfosoma sp.]
MDEVRQVAAWVHEQLGLMWDASAESEIRRKLSAAAEERGFPGLEAFVRHLFSNLDPSERLKILASILTIGETYFFREPESFVAFRRHVLPQLMAFRDSQGLRHIRLWSAGCSTGEEAYTLAMVTKEALSSHAAWDFSVLATDINERALETAREGLYRPWSFRKPVPLPYEKYVESVGLFRRVGENVKTHVTFSFLNLTQDTYPSPWTKTTDLDAIFCRNVLMYFDSEKRRFVLERLHQALHEAGWLVLGASELHLADSKQWESVPSSGTIFLRKRPSRTVHKGEAQTEKGTLLRQRRAPFEAPAPVHAERGRDLGTDMGFRRGSVAVAPFLPKGDGCLVDGPMTGRSAATPSETKDSSTQAWQAEIMGYVSAGLLDEAVHCLERFLSRGVTGSGNDFSQAVTAVVQFLAARGLSEKALELMDRVLAVHKFEPAYHHIKGALHADRGELDAAAAAFRQMLYVDPQSTTALFSLGMLCRRQGRHEAARRYLEHAWKMLQGRGDGVEVPFSDGMSTGQMRRLIERFLGVVPVE